MYFGIFLIFYPLVRVCVHVCVLACVGEGQFGQVFKAQASGIVPGDNTRNIVAVKTVKGKK